MNTINKYIGYVDKIGGEILSMPPENGNCYGVLDRKFIRVVAKDKEQAFKVRLILMEEGVNCNITYFEGEGYSFVFAKPEKDIKLLSGFNALGFETIIDLESIMPIRKTILEEQSVLINGREVKNSIEKIVTYRPIQTFDELDLMPCYLAIVSECDLNISKIPEDNIVKNLFSYKTILKKVGYSSEDVKKTLSILNTFVLNNVITQKELEEVLRENQISEKFFCNEEGKFQHCKFGDYIINAFGVIRVDGMPYIFNRRGLFSNRIADFEEIMVDAIPNIKSNVRKEVYSYISLQDLEEVEFVSPKYIGLKSGVLDLETMKIAPYNPNLIIRNKIDYDYKPDAYNELLDKTLDKICCNDKNLRLLLEEFVGYCLYPSNKFQKAFILNGSGGNGKSAFLEILKKLVGYRNHTSLSLQDLEDRFKPAELSNVLANIGDDIPDRYLKDTSLFKKCVTGESFTVERKHEKPFTLSVYAKFIFASNSIPKASDKTEGFLRRLVIIPFRAKFKNTDPDYDPFILDKLLSNECMEYLLKLGIEGLKRLLYNNKFTEASSSLAELEKYERENNNILDWLANEEPKIEGQPVTQVYQEYTTWCATEGLTAFEKKAFNATLYSKVEGLEKYSTTNNGKKFWAYRIK